MEPQDLPLRDLHLPMMTNWWPFAPGVWVLLILVVTAMAFLIRHAYRRWQHDGPRRLALKRLAAISSEFEKGASAATLGREISQLTRRTMLAYAPRGAVAGLTGQEWLTWLDRGLDGRPFTAGAGMILETLPYRDPQQVGNDENVRGLIDAVRARLKQPLDDNTAASSAGRVAQPITTAVRKRPASGARI